MNDNPIKTINSLPPDIIASFSSSLLNTTGWWKIDEVNEKYREWAFKKYKSNSRNMRELEEHLEIYRELYGWKIKQEAYQKSERKDKVEKPAIPVEAINKLRGKLGKDLRCAFNVGKSSDQ